MTTGLRTSERNRSIFFPPVALDAIAGKPIYRQLYDWFQTAIAEGRLHPGQRVPSTRRLAAELKVSRIPVLTAYEQLLAEGYFETSRGTGTAVAISIPQLGVASADRTNRPGLKSVRRPRLARRIEMALTIPFDPVPPPGTAFGACQPAVREFPHQIWSSLIARHARRMPVATMGYGDVMGHLALREVIAEYLTTTRGVRCDPSQIMIVAGSQHGLQVAARTLLDEGDSIWMENPGYPRARRAFWMVGAKLIPVPIDNEGLDVRTAIRRCSHARAAYVTPSHQYPMGMTLSATRRMQLLDWASRANAWIIEDDYNSEFRFAGRPVAALQGIGSEDRVIYLGTFSKVLFPALRIGYLVIPKVLVRPFCVARDSMDIFPAPFLQEVLTEFVREGHFSRHTRRMRLLYSSRQKSLLSALHSVLGFRANIVGTDAGMHLVVKLPSAVDDVELGRRVAKVGLAVTPLSSCYHHPNGQKGLILGYGGVDERTIEASVKLLGSEFSKYSLANCR